MTAGTLAFGRESERLAVEHLVRHGYRILSVNQRIGRGEIDIIARRGHVLAFVEVKARRTHACGAPEEAVTVHKRRQIARLAALWLGSHPRALAGVDDVRFDIIAVDALQRPPEIRHLEAAFMGDA